MASKLKKAATPAPEAAPAILADGRVRAGTDSTKTMADIRKMFHGSGVCTGRKFVEESPRCWPVSPRFDLALGGGFMQGSIITIVGDTGCGKTTTCLNFAGDWQESGREVVYCGVEGRLTEQNMNGVPLLRPDEMHVICSDEDRTLTAQDYIDSMEMIIERETEKLIILDSISMLCDLAEKVGKHAGEAPPAAVNRIIGSFMRRILPVIPIRKHIMIIVAQQYSNIGGKKKWAANMPTKVRFSRQTGLVCNWHESITAGPEGKERPVGQLVHWQVERSPYGPPNVKFDSIIRYGKGIDKVAEAIDIGVELGLIEKSGGWHEFTFMAEPKKVNGAEKARDFLESDPEALKILMERIAYLIRPEPEEAA